MTTQALAVPTMAAQDAAQIRIEEYYSTKHINAAIEDEINSNPSMAAKVQQGVSLLTDWLAQPYYRSKQARLQQLDPMSLEQLVLDVFVSVSYCQAPTLFVNVAGQMAHRMGFDDHSDSIKTVSEVIAILCQTDAFDITKESQYTSLMVTSRVPLSDAVLGQIDRSIYLPPMVCPPEVVLNNFESAYLTHNDSLILGTNNNHSHDICLDVINTQNSVALTLNREFLNSVPELPTHELDTAEKLAEWHQFHTQSQEIYRLLIAEGNEFYLTNKVDKRGRLYAQGYHVNTQGTPFKKAMIELAHKELITGVPV